jgi:hypothetical protein
VIIPLIERIASVVPSPALDHASPVGGGQEPLPARRSTVDIMLLAADIPAHVAKAPVPAGCAQRVEGIVIDANATRAVQALPANPDDDVIRGPFYLGGAKHPRPSGDGPQRSAKLPAFLGTGHTATLTVDAAHRDWARLHFGATSASVSLIACPADTAIERCACQTWAKRVRFGPVTGPNLTRYGWSAVGPLSNNSSSPASSSTGTPSDSALVSFVPAFSPATT